MAKILVIDDSEAIRLAVRKDLELEGHEVSEADNGMAGLEILKKNHDYQLIISDYNMPKLDGISMCKKIHEDPEINTIPIFLLTTASTIRLKTIGKEAGVTAWIIKPHDTSKLINAVRKVIKS